MSKWMRALRTRHRKAKACQDRRFCQVMVGVFEGIRDTLIRSWEAITGHRAPRVGPNGYIRHDWEVPMLSFPCNGESLRSPGGEDVGIQDFPADEALALITAGQIEEALLDALGWEGTRPRLYLPPGGPEADHAPEGLPPAAAGGGAAEGGDEAGDV